MTAEVLKIVLALLLCLPVLVLGLAFLFNLRKDKLKADKEAEE